MFGISFLELSIVMMLAIIIIGPKDLPALTKNIIKIIIKIKNFIHQTISESGIEEIATQIEEDLIKEKKQLEKEVTTIIDIYGNEHQVQDVDKLRTDLKEEELKKEISKHNKINRKKPSFKE